MGKLWQGSQPQSGAEDVESRSKIGRRGQPLQGREPMPGAEDVESRPKIGRRGQPLQDREPMPGAEDVESRPGRRGADFYDTETRLSKSKTQFAWHQKWTFDSYSICRISPENPYSRGGGGNFRERVTQIGRVLSFSIIVIRETIKGWKSYEIESQPRSWIKRTQNQQLSNTLFLSLPFLCTMNGLTKGEQRIAWRDGYCQQNLGYHSAHCTRFLVLRVHLIWSNKYHFCLSV